MVYNRLGFFLTDFSDKLSRSAGILQAIYGTTNKEARAKRFFLEKRFMKNTPPKARYFLWSIYAAGVAAAVWTFCFAPPLHGPHAAWWEYAAFVIAGALAGKKKLSIIPRFLAKNTSTDASKRDDNGFLSLSFAITFAALLRVGPEGAILSNIASTVVSCLLPRQAWHQFAFNIALSCLGTGLSGAAFVALNHQSLHLDMTASAPALCIASLVFFFVNTVSVAAVICLHNDEPVFVFWRENFMWTAPSFFIGAAVSTAASSIVGSRLDNTLLFGSPVASLFGTLLFGLPIAMLTYLSFKKYLDHATALAKSKDDLATLYLATIRSLALAIDAKDQYTHKHILRVQKYAVATAMQMGMTGDELKAMETGALLHDIGKLGVPEYVLLKPGRLTDDEFDKIKQHPNIGADILDPVTFPWPVLPIVKHHHERMDGTGYPDGLKGEEIPLSARVLAVADVYDAITSSRSYRSAWSHERAMEEIRDKSGTHFDPVVVDAFCAVIDKVLVEIAADIALEEAQAATRLDLAPASSTGETAAPRTDKDAATTPRSVQAARHIQRASSELWALYEVAQTLSASLGIADTLLILASKLNNIFPDTGCVFLLRDFGCGDDDNAQEVFMARSAVGLNALFFDGCQTLSANSLSLKVARERVAYLGHYDHDDLMPNSLTGSAWSEIGTALIVPIVHQGQTLGTINLYHADANAFGPHDQYLLEMIGERAALALYNGLLFDRTRSDAITDPLTGLFNIRHFTERVEERIRQAHQTGQTSDADNPAPFALLCLDLDSFKPINDNFGHQRGDRVLSDVAQLLGSLVGKNDVVSRYGGDEFLILLDNAVPNEAAQTARCIQEAVAAYDPKLRHGRLGDLRVDVSVGLACFPENGADCATLLSVADAAMYANKTERKLKTLVGMERSLYGSAMPPPPMGNIATANRWGAKPASPAKNNEAETPSQTV